MPPPTNTTAATATAIATLPASVSVDLSAVAPGDLHLWWTYTPGAGAVLISVWGTIDGAASVGALTVWTGTPGALAIHLDIDGIIGVQTVPVTPAVTYYLELLIEVAPASPPWVLSILPAPTTATVDGTLLINDDAPGFPAAYLSPVNGTVLQYRPLPAAGETAAMLRTGVSLWEADGTPTVLRLYDATMTLVASPAVPGRAAMAPIGGNRSTRFYVAVGNQVRTVLPNGSFGPQTWTTPGPALYALEPSPDDLVLYYVRDEAAQAVKRWDLVNDVALTDLAPAIADYGAFARWLLVLPDGSVIVTYSRALVAFPWAHSLIRRYSPSGAILHTYDLGGVRAPRLAYHWPDEGAAFWIWTYAVRPAGGGRDGYTTFRLLRVSDGAVLRTFDAVLFATGAYEPNTEPPTARFGLSESCAFIVLPLALPEPPGTGTNPPTAYTVDERHLRRLRRAPHVNHEDTRLFFRSFELDLERGQGRATGQGDDPIITLRLSRDGGQTWGEPIPMHAGKLGAYTQRVMARRLGVARDTVFEVTTSDPVAWSLVGAWLDLEPGTS